MNMDYPKAMELAMKTGNIADMFNKLRGEPQGTIRVAIRKWLIAMMDMVELNVSLLKRVDPWLSMSQVDGQDYYVFHLSIGSSSYNLSDTVDLLFDASEEAISGALDAEVEALKVAGYEVHDDYEDETFELSVLVPAPKEILNG